MSRHSGLKKSASLQDGLASPSENSSHHVRKGLFRQHSPPFAMFMVIHFFAEVKQKIAAQGTFFTRFLPALVLSYRYRHSWQFIVYNLQLAAYGAQATPAQGKKRPAAAFAVGNIRTAKRLFTAPPGGTYHKRRLKNERKTFVFNSCINHIDHRCHCPLRLQQRGRAGFWCGRPCGQQR